MQHACNRLKLTWNETRQHQIRLLSALYAGFLGSPPDLHVHDSLGVGSRGKGVSFIVSRERYMRWSQAAPHWSPDPASFPIQDVAEGYGLMCERKASTWPLRGLSTSAHLRRPYLIIIATVERADSRIVE